MAKAATQTTTKAPETAATKQDVATVSPAEAKALALKAELAGSGFENDTHEDYVLPFFTILQGLSPQMETVDGAKLGLIINTTTNALYGTSIDFVAVRKEHKFVEWLPNRGGFVAAYDPEDPIVKKLQAESGNDKFAKLQTEAGNDLIDTKYLYGIRVVDGEPVGFGCIAFSSTKMKKFNAWNTSARELFMSTRLKMHDVVYRFQSGKDKNKKGEFFNWMQFGRAGATLEEAKVKPGSALALAIDDFRGKDVKLDHAAERPGDEAGDGDSM